MDVSRHILQNACIGYWIMNQHWGRGYGKTSLQLLLEIGFKELNLHRLEAWIQTENKPSIALAKSAGLQSEGLSKKRLYINGKWTDMLQYVAHSENYGVKCKPTKLKSLPRF